MSIILSQLFIFPVKSCAPVTVEYAEVKPRGLAHDRRWMIVDAQGHFLTGRQDPRLTLIRAMPEQDGLMLNAPGMPVFRLSVPAQGERVSVTIWNDSVAALLADAQANIWISRYLGVAARFAYMDKAGIRPVDLKYAQSGDTVSFADAYPLLLISQAALDQLNTKLTTPVPMLRFRPNLVVSGTAPHAEDGWKRIRIGVVEFDLVKPCSRCVFTTVDYERGERDPSGEPLRTLITYRRTANGVTFGQNLIPRGSGTVRTGDRVEVVE